MSLARNTALNLVGGIVPPLMGLLTMPYIIHGLGVERFGMLSLAWAALNYFTAFDVGLGRATLKFTAQALGDGRLEDIPSIVGTTLLWQLGLSSVGAVLLAVSVPLLLTSTIRMPSYLVGETKGMFYVLALSIPVIICSLSLRRVVEAAQRFDLANAVRIPAHTALFWVPAIAVSLDFRLQGIAALLLLSQVAAGIAYAVAAMCAIPVLRGALHFDRRLNGRLLSYGGWVAVSSMVNPIVAFLDRFMVGALLSVAAVAFYAVPFEMLMRVNYIVPSCLGATLFPAFSALGDARHGDVERIYRRSLKYMLIMMGLMALVFILLSEDILRLWLGPEFARNSASVFQFLALGFFFAGMAWLPTTYLQSMGRPDLVSKVLIVEVVGFTPVSWLFIHRWGIQGAAFAMVLRYLFELCALAAVPSIAMRSRVSSHRGLVVGWSAVLALAATSLWIAPSFMQHRIVQAGATSGILLAFAGVAWLWVLNESDRKSLTSLVAGKTSNA